MIGNKYLLTEEYKRTYYFFKEQWEDDEALIWVKTNIVELNTDRKGNPHTLYFGIANDIDLPVHVAKKYAQQAKQISNARYLEHMHIVNAALSQLEKLSTL